MAEFKINRIRYNWKDLWTAGTAYNRDDVVRVGGKTYVCLMGNTAASHFDTDLVNGHWVQMTEGVLWRGSWTDNNTATPKPTYVPGDLVIYSGVVYICVNRHQSQTLFDTNIADWAIYNSSSMWTTDWMSNMRYGIGDLVRYNGIVYRCTRGHTSASTSNGLEVGNYDSVEDSTLEVWEIYSAGEEYRGDWANDVRYRANDLVKFGGSIWKCTVGHTSGDDSTLNFNDGYFSVEIPGQDYRGEWDDMTPYGIGDITRYGGYLYICLRNDTQETPSVSTSAWLIVSKNYNYRGEWNNTEDYQTGDIITRNGRLMIARNDTTGQTPTVEVVEVTVDGPRSSDVGDKFLLDAVYLGNPILTQGNTYVFNQTSLTNLYYPNANFTTLNPKPLKFSTTFDGSAYLNDVVYKLDEMVVTLEEYVANFTTANTRTVELTVNKRTPAILYYGDYITTGVGSYLTISPITYGLEPTVSVDWETLIPGEQWVGGWATDRDYADGDLVTYKNYVYKCATSHISDINENYPDNGNGFDYWTTYLIGDEDNALAVKGDLLSYGVTVDQSTLAPIAIAVGSEYDLLTIEDNNTIGYRRHGAVQNLIYVAPHGADADGYGINLQTPFKTIRYAAEHAATLTGNTTIFVKTGLYYEVLPIIVPAGCCILGEEVRGVTVSAAPAIEALAGDITYNKAVLQRMKDIIPDIIQNNLIIKTIGNTETQVTTFAGGSLAAATAITSLIDKVKQYLDFYINSTGTEPAVTGTNTSVVHQGFVDAANVLEANKEFLAEEARAYTALNYPTYSFNPDSCMRDIRRYVEAWKYDIIYTGTYKTILAARYYKNAVLGSSGEDMFYLRDASGLRNMTLRGLIGQLNPSSTYELYRRPTGGAYASFDPGWGPNDDRAWINTRSPYIQNCATQGYAAIGQRLNGALHNGGNKSFVSNDFTQLISDGIGAWVYNGARAELVSVFTYYAHIGYFAETGGRIRATNGNNSYGTYGAAADGNDPAETPRFGYVNNRLTEASVYQVFAGESNNNILGVEFLNAGQYYTTANWTFSGSGTGVSVLQEEFRDNAIYDVHIINPPDSGTFGGGGYSTAGGNAQSGGLYSITISGADTETLASNYIGKRIIIISGTGTGQYAKIQDYDPLTKVLTPYKESDGTPGWDHLVPGTPLAIEILTNCVYRIEPLPVFSDPGFTASQVNMSSSVAWGNIVYGESTRIFASVAGTAGSGTTVDVIPDVALWNIAKNGRVYTVTLAYAGAGYADNQTITISGSLAGGIDIDNDIIITVTQISDDSTNAITGFTYSGSGTSGNFVATSTSANTVCYSPDGETWSTGSLPSSGDWSALAAGGNKFVAIKYGTNEAAWSYTGAFWSGGTQGGAVSMPAARNWNGVAYGNGIFVAVAGDQNSAAYSTDGVTWVSSTMPSAGDSTINEWIDVTYGQGKFVAVANSQNWAAVGTWTGSALVWTPYVMDAVSDSTPRDWTSVTFGNNRFVTVSSTGDVAYSLDGYDWYASSMPKPDDSTPMAWRQIRYGQGVFFAVCDTGARDINGDPTTGQTLLSATSPDGITWTTRTMANTQSWAAVAFGNPDITVGDSTATNSSPMWVAVTSDIGSVANKILTGARARGRCIVESSRITKVTLWEPGSGYAAEPTLTIVDPGASAPVYVTNRLGDGVMAQPSWVSRGGGYKTSTTQATIVGDGYADVIPVSRYVTLDGLQVLPGPGAQFRFGGSNTLHTVVVIQYESSQSDGTQTATFQISPYLTVRDDIQHGTSVEIRELYSQCRITGHDFLDIGTGNYEDTNYPLLYSTGDYFSAPENEIYEVNGGRVFYTSTDQNGNFRTGELFAVEQATGVVTISADFFDLQGLTELRLGGVRLGGTGTVIREFSTDATFLEDSNNIIPTQRAIKAYLTNRLNVGGADLSVPSFIAGYTKVGPKSMSVTTTLPIEMGVNRTVRFEGDKAGISGTMLAQTMFHSSFYNE
jgi:hypothetical protein